MCMCVCGLQVVTGAGRHSVDVDGDGVGDPKIKPVVERLLKEAGLKFEVEHGDGSLKVTG